MLEEHKPLVLQEALVLTQFFLLLPQQAAVGVEAILDRQMAFLVALAGEVILVGLLEAETPQPHLLRAVTAHLLLQAKAITEGLVALLHQIMAVVAVVALEQLVLLERVLLEVRVATAQLQQLAVLPRHTQVAVAVEQKMVAQVAQAVREVAVQE